MFELTRIQAGLAKTGTAAIPSTDIAQASTQAQSWLGIDRRQLIAAAMAAAIARLFAGPTPAMGRPPAVIAKPAEALSPEATYGIGAPF